MIFDSAAALLYWLASPSAVGPDLLVVFMSALAVRIDFQGLVDLVSDRSADPGEAWVLAPNGEEPDATWIPPALRFHPSHHPRIVVTSGTVSSASPGLEPTQYPADQGEPAFSLSGVELAISNATAPPLTANRTPAQNPPVDESSLDYLGQMDHLADLMGDEGHAPELGPVSEELLSGTVVPVEARITSRLHVDKGHLEVSSLWREAPSDPPAEVRFQLHPAGGMVSSYEAYLGRSLVLQTQVDDEIVLSFRRLEDGGQIGNLVVGPAGPGDEISLVVRNTEAGSEGDGNEFLGHYLIRDGWQGIERARIPDTTDWVGSAGLDPQCTPGDNGGGG